MQWPDLVWPRHEFGDLEQFIEASLGDSLSYFLQSRTEVLLCMMVMMVQSLTLLRNIISSIGVSSQSSQILKYRSLSTMTISVTFIPIFSPFQNIKITKFKKQNNYDF